MKINSSSVAIVLLAVGVIVLSVCLFKSDDASAAPRPATVERPREAAKASVPEVPGAVERALRRRIKQLEAELAAARASMPPSTNAPAPSEPRALPNRADMRPPNPREWMADLRKNDPKQYEEMQKRFAQFRQRRMERTKGRIDFLSSVDTAGMSDAELKNHDKLQELLAKREGLPDISPDMSDEEAKAAMDERRSLDHAIRQASAAERTALLKQTATAIGLQGDDAKVLTDTIQDVLRATESGHGPGMPPPPGGGR